MYNSRRGVEKSMQSTNPKNLSDQELVHYADVLGYETLSPEWVEELAKRLEYRIEEADEPEAE